VKPGVQDVLTVMTKNAFRFFYFSWFTQTTKIYFTI